MRTRTNSGQHWREPIEGASTPWTQRKSLSLLVYRDLKGKLLKKIEFYNFKIYLYYNNNANFY